MSVAIGIPFGPATAQWIVEGRKVQTRRLPQSVAKITVGTRLYVQEPFAMRRGQAVYRACEPDAFKVWLHPFRMTESQSRAQIRVVRCWSEALQQIEREDVLSEGFSDHSAFRTYWDRIHPEDPWSANPTVVVLQFERVPAP